MRFFPIITAILISTALYLLTFERDALIAMAGGEATEQNQDGYLPAQKSEAVSVKVLISTSKVVESGVVVRGRTEAARNVVVRAETSGLIISEPLSKGSKVKENQLLCELNVGTREVKLAEANARLVEAQVNNNAASRLAESGYGSETKAIARKASLQSAEANVKLAEKEIERLRIYAPFSGLLGSDVAEIGSLLQPGSECARIVKLDPMRLVGFVAESEVDKLSLNATAGARLANDKLVRGRVTYVAVTADPMTRTFRIEVEVPNQKGLIREGGTAEIFISTSGERAHLLPQSAMTLNNDGDLGIRAVVDEFAKFYKVKIVRDTTDGIWLSGLPDKVEVIIVGQEYVVDGRKVLKTYQE